MNADPNKIDALTKAGDKLANSAVLWQMLFYHSVCLRLCDRFTPEEIQTIITDHTERINKRITESEAPCASS